MAMSRQRALPPDIFTDELLLNLPLEVRWTAIGLRMHADDFGRETANARLIASSVWPLNPEMTDETVEEHLLDLDEAGYIVIYAAAGRTFYAIADWPSVSHPVRSKFPPPPERLQSASGASPEHFSAVEGEREWRASGGAGEGPAGIPPSPFCKLHQPSGTHANCRHCGTARLAHEQWLREHQEEP